jgi:hypothetical protein
VRNASKGGPGLIDRIDFAARRAIELPDLGIYTNNVNPSGVLAPAPNGGTILAAMPDGNVMLYDANADTFTVSRKDYAASVRTPHQLQPWRGPQKRVERVAGSGGGVGVHVGFGVRICVRRPERIPHHGVRAFDSGRDRALRRVAGYGDRQADPPG